MPNSKRASRNFVPILDTINRVLAYFSGALLAVVTLAICIEVIVRKILGYSIIGIMESSEYALVFITFLSASWILRHEAHVKADLVLGWLQPRNKALLNMVTSFFGAALCMFMTYRSALVIWDLWQRNLHSVKALELPMAPLYTSIFVGSLMLSLGFLVRAYGYLVERKATMSTP